jgi:hypothetical protein
MSQRKLADWEWEAVGNGRCGVVGQLDKRILPDQFFEPPQIRCLVNAGGPAPRAQGKDEVGEMSAKERHVGNRYVTQFSCYSARDSRALRL